MSEELDPLDERLARAPSEARLGILLDLWGECPKETLNKLLVRWWESIELPSGFPQRRVVGMFRWAGFVTDSKVPLKNRTSVIYRGATSRYRFGLCWTLDIEIARFFAHTYRRRSPGGLVYRAKINHDNVLGYITCRDEQEVIVDPYFLSKVTLIERRTNDGAKVRSPLTG